ncbi:hypothetical protein Droror1_Dr00025776 [Drosera rotundifolia]
MKKRGRPRKPSATALFTSPPPPTTAAVSSPSSPDSPKSFEFKSTTARRKPNAAAMTPPNASPSPGSAAMMTKSSTVSIADLKEMVASRLETVKRQVDLAHAEFGREVEGSQARIHKRYKIQAQACQQVMDQADKEYKKISERIAESREAMQASYAEIIAEAQATASRVCKSSIPDLAQSFEKAIDALRSRYGISAASL